MCPRQVRGPTRCRPKAAFWAIDFKLFVKKQDSERSSDPLFSYAENVPLSLSSSNTNYIITCFLFLCVSVYPSIYLSSNQLIWIYFFMNSLSISFQLCLEPHGGRHYRHPPPYSTPHLQGGPSGWQQRTLSQHIRASWTSPHLRAERSQGCIWDSGTVPSCIHGPGTVT